MERLVRFTLFGQEFSFYTDAPENEVTMIVNLVKRELEQEGQGGRATFPSSKILVLGCLRIAARYVELKQEFEDFKMTQDAFIDKLIDKVSTEIGF